MAPAIDKTIMDFYTTLETFTVAPNTNTTVTILVNITKILQTEATDLSDLIQAGYFGVIDTCHIIEYFLLICHLIIPTYYLFLAYTRSVVHVNLQLIVSAFVAQSYPMAVARYLLIQEERNGLAQSTTFLSVISFIRCGYVASLFLSKLAALMERLIAAFYVQTYEHSRRYCIPISLIFLVHCGSLTIAYLILNTYITYIQLFVAVMISQAFVIPVMLIIYRVNSKASETFNKNSSNYSLSMRYQLYENFRILRLTSFIMIMVSILFFIAGLMMYIKTTITAPIITSIVGLIYQIFMTALPLTEYVVFHLAFREWRSHLFGIFGYSTSHRTSVVDQLGTHQHFEMLSRSWQ